MPKVAKAPCPGLKRQMRKNTAAWIAAIAVPLLYLLSYTPYGMDTTDFGYFYAYAWRILKGQIPYRDFFYIKPAFPLYWHAFWLWLTPAQIQILAGKAAFCVSLLAASWLGSLYLNRFFDLARTGVSLPLLATCGFVFGVHSFPHMPWHTADGVLFCAASLYAAAASCPVLAGITAACAVGCKQSFALVPVSLALLLWFNSPRRELALFICAFCASLLIAVSLLVACGAWENFLAMTTGQLALAEALDAGILIYLRQNWLIPCAACLPWLICLLAKKRTPVWLEPAFVYLPCLAAWYIYNVETQRVWIGYGASWPTLFLVLGGIAVLLPGQFLRDIFKPSPAGRRLLRPAIALACPLVVSWSTAISGGYKIPAMFAAPLVFSFLLFHSHFFKKSAALAWLALCAGLVMFWTGYQYPYVFPVRPLARSEMVHDAGSVYPQARGVLVDRDMYERLAELKALREKYGPNYKTLPGFPFSAYLNGDEPVAGSDWLIDWEINGEIDKLYRQLMDQDVTVFMERDQMDAKRADAYERAGYGVPQLVRKNWRIVGETPHFVIFRKPL